MLQGSASPRAVSTRWVTGLDLRAESVQLLDCCWMDLWGQVVRPDLLFLNSTVL